MFTISSDENPHSLSNEAPFAYRSSDELRSTHLLNEIPSSKFQFADPKHDLSFGAVDALGLYDQSTESGPSSVQYGGFDGISDIDERGQSPRHLLEPASKPSSQYINLVTSSDGQSQLPTPEESGTYDQDSKIDSIPSPTRKDLQGSAPLGIVPPPLNLNPQPPPISSEAYATPDSSTRKIPKKGARAFSETSLAGSPSAKPHDKANGSARKRIVGSAGYEMRPRASIPQHLTAWEFSRQCALAAYSSRLNPYALHPGEYELLKTHLTLPQVTIYLNIRNAILRLWTRNPMVPVRLDEAAGCARDARYISLTAVSHEWLLRHGYINFGCVDVVPAVRPVSKTKVKAEKGATIVVVGAGMSGLGCARQLECLISQYSEHWTDRGEKPPRVIVLEGRKRLGGRVYSHVLDGRGRGLPTSLRSTAEMGAQIVTGFEHGNPMNIIIRGQLGLSTYALKDTSILYDHDGKVVDKQQDQLVEGLYNDVLERASVFRNVSKPAKTAEGDRLLMQDGKEPSDDGGKTIAELEKERSMAQDTTTISSTTSQQPKQAAISTEKLTGRAYQIAGLGSRVPAAQAASAMGWELTQGTDPSASIKLTPPEDKGDTGTLGDTMDDGLMQYKNLIRLTPKDMRLFNWHNANLEYANAAKVGQLSLTGWDQDLGNEFEGAHTEVVGGYQQVPRGLWQSPYPLDVHLGKTVSAIRTENEQTKVVCSSGESFLADKVVVSVPLGVLKSQSIEFTPSLPKFKCGAIDRLGFGLLNKVIVVYEQAFWEEDRDMFGLLNQATVQDSLDQADYTDSRGRFFLFWNCIKTSGRPTLVALMAGDSAYQAEAETDEKLVQDLTSRLRKMFGAANVPMPSQSIVTRWKKDPFACGSYSYVGPATRSDDYEAMASQCNNIHFAGEATCGTHPATVHGAYLSGLRAAAEVVYDLLGPIFVPTPLVPPKAKIETTPRGAKRPHFETIAVPLNPIKLPSKAEAYEASIIGAILAELGDRPIKPPKTGINPFLLFQKEQWYDCKSSCDAEAQRKSKNPSAKAGKSDVRLALGHQWRTASQDVRKPYLDRAQASKEEAAAEAKRYEEKAKSWDREAARIREEYIATHPLPDGMDKKSLGKTSIELGRAKLARTSSGTADSSISGYQIPLFDQPSKLPL